jgi:hypothetical protein
MVPERNLGSSNRGDDPFLFVGLTQNEEEKYFNYQRQTEESELID